MYDFFFFPKTKINLQMKFENVEDIKKYDKKVSHSFEGASTNGKLFGISILKQITI